MILHALSVFYYLLNRKIVKCNLNTLYLVLMQG